MDKLSFGKWLYSRRKELGVKGIELEERTGITRQYISQLENDVRTAKSNKLIKPSEEVVEKLARALGVPVNEARLAAGYATKDQPRLSESDKLLEYFNALPETDRRTVVTMVKALYDEAQLENARKAA